MVCYEAPERSHQPAVHWHGGVIMTQFWVISSSLIDLPIHSSTQANACRCPSSSTSRTTCNTAQRQTSGNVNRCYLKPQNDSSHGWPLTLCTNCSTRVCRPHTSNLTVTSLYEHMMGSCVSLQPSWRIPRDVFSDLKYLKSYTHTHTHRR